MDVRDDFFAEFLALWALLDSERLDETGPGWITAVTRLIVAYRLLSAEVATRYYWEFRAAEVPDAPPPGASGPQTPPPPAGPVTGRPPRAGRRESASPRPRRDRGGFQGTRERGDLVIPNPRNSRVRFDIDEDAVRRSLERPGGVRFEVPEIDWKPRDRATRVSLEVTGPIGQKAKRARGKTVREARDESFVESSGAAARQVLTGGRQSLLTLLQADDRVHRWVRVTDGDPCYFCAMLASRGPVYLSRETAGFVAHDHCACTAEPVYHANAPWPGRAQEFHDLWMKYIHKQYSGAEARRQWRRIIDQMRRENRRASIA